MPHFTKLLTFMMVVCQLSFGATPEQVEQYLSVSNAEEELLALESQFSSMQNSFSKDANESESKTYDMQLLSVRFREYLEKHLSENEMADILENYRNVVLLQFVSMTSGADQIDENEIENYMETLKQSSDASDRIKLVEKISEEIYSKEAMMIMFDELMKPLMQNGIGGKDLNDNMVNASRESYLEMMMENSTKETLYQTKDFTIDELEALLTIAKTPAMDDESKAVFGGMAYALKDFFMSMASRYDVRSHMPDTNHTK